MLMHSVLWVNDAPKYGINSDSEVCDFVDKYVSAAIPENDNQLKELVLLLQKHRHSTYCKKQNTCRFDFPKPPSYYTLITEPLDEEEMTDSKLNNARRDLLAKVRKITSENNELSLDEVLAKANVNKTAYTEALQISSRGTVIVLQKKTNETCINNYNPTVLSAWKANMDIQFVLNAFACVMYIASYITKTERAMGKLLKEVADEHRTEELKTQLNKIGSAFLTNREVSAQEAVYRALSLPMKQMSRAVVFVNTNPKGYKIA